MTLSFITKGVLVRTVTYSCIVILCCALITSSQILSGSGTVKLSGPATKEQTDNARHSARKQLQKELLIWLNENINIEIDTLNKLHALNLENFVDTCLRYSKEESSFQGKSLVISFNITANDVQKAVQAYNAASESIAIESWNKMVKAREEQDLTAMYTEGIKAMANATAHLGPPLPTPGAEGKDLVEDIRISLQDFLNRMRVSSSDMILQGKTGQPVENPPVISVMVDSVPLQGVAVSGLLQNGKEIFTAVTDQQGQVSFKGMRIPFVANGTLLYVRPDPAKILQAPSFIGTKPFNLQLKNSQEQSFIFKISRPVYSLDYKATSVSKVALPADYASSTFLKKFLKDSCFMSEVSGSIPPDLNILVQSQASSYAYDETEEIGIKISSQITIKGLSLDPPSTVQETVVFEKRYEARTDIPYGLFFWEAASKLREAIKAAISRL